MKIGHIQLAIPRGTEVACRAFWTGLLGCRELEKPAALHDGLTKAQSDALNARLILLLANHIGDDTVLRDALQVTVVSVRNPPPTPGSF